MESPPHVISLVGRYYDVFTIFPFKVSRPFVLVNVFLFTVFDGCSMPSTYLAITPQYKRMAIMKKK